MMTTDPIGLYIHIPFCKEKCAYCDFCSYGGVTDSDIDTYISHLIDEIKSYREEPKIAVNTVYFGGGTPSLLSPMQVGAILDSVRNTFLVDPDSEITMEMNPGTVSRSALAAYRTLGINRASLGIQSIHENELKKLGRIHTFDEAKSAYTMLRDVGFDNISVDLMYGIPYQTGEALLLTLDEIIKMSPEHISAYGLIIEEGTRFYAEADSLPLPTDDDECDMYAMIIDRLRVAGYSHYEISNYAKPGFESRHNLKYWRDEEYIGVGVAAYSYFRKERFGNVRSLSHYLLGERSRDRELITGYDEAFEYAMMHLRLAEGISLSDYERRFGVSFISGRESLISDYLEKGFLTFDGNRIALTDSGFYVSNTLMANLL